MRNFIEQAWHIVEPGSQYVPGKHIEAIAEHLEAVTRGEIRNLIINIPPRFAKSLIVSVFWFCWTWATNPQSRWIYSSYAQSLSMRDSLKCRRIIESEWYQRNWGDKFMLTTDQNTKTRFENEQTGYRIATSVGGAATGEGGDLLVCDDPHNVQEGSSEIVLEMTRQWWDEVMSTRLNEPATGRKVIVMQRIHDKDLTGHLLKKGDYEHLCLPMKFEENRVCVTGIGWKDWRKTDGELLWPDRVNERAVAMIERALGSYGAAGQLQQRPAPRGGGMFKREWFPIEREAPADAKWVRFWDLAATQPKAGKDPDWTVGLLLGLKEGIYYVKDVKRTRSTPGGVESLITQTASTDGYNVRVTMEREPGASGVNTVDHYARRVLVGYNFSPTKDLGSKESRAEIMSGTAEAKNIRLVTGAWNETFLDELAVFPAGSFDDQVDALSGAFAALTRRAGGPVSVARVIGGS